MCTKADKGNCLVILNKCDYITKVLDFISEPGFSILKHNPTTNFTRTVRNMVYNQRHNLSTFNINYKALLNMNPVCPLLYGLPKIHKPDIPIRPVVCFTDTPVSKITAWLNSILKQHITFARNFSIKNSLNLTSKISSITLPPSFSIVSFDVKNLFPSIPSNECIQLVSEHLSSTHLSDDQYTCIITLLKLCIHQNFFKFNNQCCTQIDGLQPFTPLGRNLHEQLRVETYCH
ncbi:hypothetical protein RI129_002782 [Pyrocoelia pectoralis]|uniref:Reverse transcriptase domain-containing protein n=1 Tax=Pyrocoelia pectoralis TaxID=417401 RepID=A0AAN7VFW6_9COLE